MNIRRLAIRHLVQARFHGIAPANEHREPTIEPPIWTAATATYIICTNPRSGSWLLSEGLKSTSLAGNPREWFNAMEEQQYRARWRLDHSSDLGRAAYFRIARAESTTSNGVSAIKLHYYQFADFLKKMKDVESLHALTNAELMSKLFPEARYLWLRRRDKARQAISLYLASRTNEWWVVDSTAPHSREKRNGDPEFDPKAIARTEAGLLANDSKWQSFFENNSIPPLVVYYENLAEDYPGTVQSVLNWLDVPGADALIVRSSRLNRQSNARSEEWHARYLAFKAEVGQPGQTSPIITDRPPFERVRQPLDTVPNVWKQWVVKSMLQHTNDDAIVTVLVNNGFSHAVALAAVKSATTDPYMIGAADSQRRLNRAASLLNAIGTMACLNSQSTSVDRHAKLSRNEFRDRYYAANRPVVIEGLMTNWRAMTAWTPDYLKDVAGNRVIEVMTNRNIDAHHEMDGRKQRTNVLFADYIDMVYSGKVTDDYDMVANNGFLQRSDTARLLQDFTAFPEFLRPSTAGRQCFLWFGPGGSSVPLHHATSNILTAQVAGRKHYRLIPPSQWQYVYNNNGVFSDVDCENPDFNRHPKFRNATITDIIVEPGEVLFIPVGWWHYVRAVEISMTLTFTNFVFPNHFTWEV